MPKYVEIDGVNKAIEVETEFGKIKGDSPSNAIGQKKMDATC